MRLPKRNRAVPRIAWNAVGRSLVSSYMDGGSSVARRRRWDSLITARIKGIASAASMWS